MHVLLKVASVVMTLALLANTASAVNIAKDSFLVGDDPSAGEYNTSKNFDTSPAGSDPQNPTVAGFTGAWNNGGTGLWRPIDIGLDHVAVFGEAGGSALFQFNSEVGLRNVKRNLTSPPAISTGGEFWVAGLVQLVENDLDFDGFAYAGFASDLNNNNSTQGLKFGVEGNGVDGMDLVVRHRAGTVVATSENLGGINPGDTHLVVMQVMVNSDLGGGSVPGNDNVNVWLNPASVISEAALGAPTLSFEDFSLFNNNGFNFLTFEGSNITGGGVRFDELALGTSLQGVVAGLPEPTTALLGLMGVGGMLARRRRNAA